MYICPQRPEDSALPAAGVTGSCELPIVSVLNSCPLQEPCVLLATEPFTAPGFGSVCLLVAEIGPHILGFEMQFQMTFSFSSSRLPCLGCSIVSGSEVLASLELRASHRGSKQFTI